MKSVLVRLREYQKEMSVAETGVVRYLLDTPEQAVKLSVHALAEKGFSSSSTVIRLCHELGFSGYKEMKAALICELAIRQENTREKMEEITENDTLEQIVDKITYKNIASLEDTRNLTDISALKNCIDLLCQCRTICLFGIGSSLLVARDAYLKFLRINKPCILNDDWHSQLLQARNMSRDDLGLMISYSGRTMEMIECARTMQQVGAKFILITRFAVSPLSEMADYNLYVAANESIFRSGAMGSRISQLNIIDILYTAYANHNSQYSLSQWRKTHISKKNPSYFEPFDEAYNEEEINHGRFKQDDNRKPQS
ncbi:MurR/RpiR family transcriptional regulator [Lacrimispora sphenoides]|uniref:DNA-binding transcriptional regulator, MurR/RpiR family, contains HTH and SIS domains n=1 Tax=Lacrimispora sphenoides JCM 1415 TaxID=1297793 RepID=A0ABY1C1J1_9FIRM|nr:MurR/RpiR family transcriptional regulator [Lacrimispora sphenoides]SET52928.1 DNA-binding transcriptional regulator, MurR/RpiR family, contains HTH and SIS domains [[Clostridium] sphenoides JCM 1415]SUY49617.1 RpiR family transcriptional regulator [Lacrimispora sphenoides]